MMKKVILKYVGFFLMERKKLLRAFEINIFTIKYLDKIPTTSLNVSETTEPTTS